MDGISEAEYGMRYYAECLSNLDPREVYEELGKDSILICYEKTGFCHRHLVAKWFEMSLLVQCCEIGEENVGLLDRWIK